MQLIKYGNESIENRWQEISSITRDLKILAKDSRSPIVLLSQLNRNVENRANKRPLLSDLRESGCIGCINSPNTIKNSQAQLLFESMYLQAGQQILETGYSQGRIHKIRKQYVYLVKDYKKISACISHNHRILIRKGWEKIDQIKQRDRHHIKQRVKIGFISEIEISRLYKIKLIGKENVYDITLYEHSNFLTGKYIVHNSIEQDADLVLMLYQNNEHLESNTIDVVVAKHRNGPVGSFSLLFHADICKFENMEAVDLGVIY